MLAEVDMLDLSHDRNGAPRAAKRVNLARRETSRTFLATVPEIEHACKSDSIPEGAACSRG